MGAISLLKHFSSTLSTFRRPHTGGKAFACKLYLKPYAPISNSHEHAIVHTGQKPYVYKICAKQFFQSSNLHTHSRLILEKILMPSISVLKKFLGKFTRIIKKSENTPRENQFFNFILNIFFFYKIISQYIYSFYLISLI